MFLLKLEQPLMPRYGCSKGQFPSADLPIVTIQIFVSLVCAAKLLGLRFRLPELHIGTVVFDYGKHAGVQVIE